MNSLDVNDFIAYFEGCHGHPPFAWQKALAERVLTDDWPEVLALPTAAGKTAVLDVALFALAAQANLPALERTAPRRIVFVVDRRIVVDATAQRAERIRDRLCHAPPTGILGDIRTRLLRYGGESPLCCAELRGGIWRDERWARTPLQPTVLVSTVDQVGSRLLHRGYGLSSGARPIHAGLLANDALIVLDEAHLSRPFEDTLKAIAKYRRWAESPLPLPFRFVRMSATPGTMIGNFPASPEIVINDPRLESRLVNPKLANLMPVEAKGDAFEKACVHAALEMVRPGETLAIIVNRVATARNIHCRLEESACSKKPKFKGTSLLLTGRCRSIQRDALLKQYGPRILAGRDRQEDADRPPLVVVATQCVEAGADFDFDTLITECCPLDSLRQRFGRLNRLGERPSAGAVIVAGADTVNRKADPIYGEAMANTWQWLVSQPQPIDFASASIAGQLPADIDSLLAQTLEAPLIYPAYCDLWVQTAPESAPSPDPAIFLHGPTRGEPDVQIVWRADLDPNQLDTWLEAVTMTPPLMAECLNVRLSEARAWLAQDSEKQSDTGDIQGALIENGRQQSERSKIPLLIWRGPNHSLAPMDHQGDLRSIRPGDTLIVPASAGGCDRFGWNPEESRQGNAMASVEDLADPARLAAQRPPQLRLHPLLAETWGTAAEPLMKLTDLSPEDDDAETKVKTCFKDIAVSSNKEIPDWLRQTCEALAQDFKLLRRADGCWIALSRKRWSAEAADFDDSGDSSAAVKDVGLSSHLMDVADLASQFADGGGFCPAIRASIAFAARCHDLGKADPRFQALLCGGDRALAIRAELRIGDVLAKSPSRPRTRKAGEQAQARSSYPKGARHELLSLRLAEAIGVPDSACDPELALHMIAAHHGYCRPFAPIVNDAEPVTVRYAFDGKPFEASSSTKLEALDSGVAERFWTLIRRYGWWGLSYLETLVRLADHRVSERYESRENLS